jgi:hypothetical protein
VRSLAAIVVVLALAACGSSDRAETGPPPVDPGPAVVFVSMGSSETAGSDLEFPQVLQDRWTQVLYRDSLPTRAVHINTAEGAQLVNEGVADELPLALSSEPTIATVWFGLTDELVDTPVGAFKEDLDRIVGALVRAGARVFVATDAGTKYDAVIAEVVESEGAVAVSVSGLSEPLGAEGHAAVAERFADAIGTVP